MKKQKFTLSKLLWLFIVFANVLLANNQVYATNYTSLNDGAWSDATKWTPNGVPTTADNVTISHLMQLNSNATCTTLNITTNGRLTFSAGKTLTISGLLTLAGSIELSTESNATSSIIFGSLVDDSGFITYRRWFSGAGALSPKIWHTVASPVESQTLSVKNAGTLLGTSNDGALYAFANYNESTNKWNYISYVNRNSWPSYMSSGLGYTLAKISDGLISFEGTPVSGSVSVGIKHSTGATEPVGGWGWNALGNPYTSAISAGSFYSTNSSQLDPNYGGLYVWDPGSQGYSIITQATGGYVQMGQGFVVRSKDGGGSVTFNYAMRAHSPGTAYKSANLLTGVQTSTDMPVQSIVLNAQSGNILRNTTFVFAPGMTTALDPYYDAGLLPSGGGLDIYSKLIDDKGINFGLQALPNTGFNELVIPVLIDLDAAGEVAFTSKLTNLPDGYKVVLEDRVTGATTSLNDDNAKYAVNLPANTVGLKRFYLHVSNLTTGIIENVSEGKLNVFTSGKSINILGSVLSQSKAYLYNLTGSRVAAYDLDASGTNIINIDQLNAGVYLIQIIEGKKQKYTGKIILN